MIQTLSESADRAVDLFHVFDDGSPDLIPTGLPIDEHIGGLFPGQGGILGAETGCGKSSIMLDSVLRYTKSPVGIISLEDTPDVLGSRAIATLSGVNSLKLRTNKLTESEKLSIANADKKLRKLSHIHIAYCVGTGLPEIVKSIDELAKRGCRLVWIDYIQKIRGISNDRRNEVGTAFTTLQRACDIHGVACMFISQFSRQQDREDGGKSKPKLSWLKETGDLENETRLAILCERSPHGVTARVAKSTFGGEGHVWSYRRNHAGVLVLT